MGDTTSLKVKKKTRDRLALLGRKAETFDDIVSRLVNFYTKNNKRFREVK